MMMICFFAIAVGVIFKLCHVLWRINNLKIHQPSKAWENKEPGIKENNWKTWLNYGTLPLLKPCSLNKEARMWYNINLKNKKEFKTI